MNGAATKSQPEHSEAFRSVSKHFEALQIERNTSAITAHNYPWRARRADFTRAPGGQGSLTAKRGAAGAALTVRGAVVTKISTARPRPLCADCRHDLGSARFSSFSAWGVQVKSTGILLVL